jgi:hypothetical protein
MQEKNLGYFVTIWLASYYKLVFSELFFKI